MRLIDLLRIFLLLLSSFQLKAQLPPCGTDEYELNFIKHHYENNYNLKKSSQTDSTVYCLPLNVFIIGKSDSSGIYPMDKLNRELDTINYHFKKAHIQFYLLPINYIYNTSFYDTLNGSEQSSLSSQLSLQDTINIYFTPGLNVCGVAKFSLPLTPIFINTGCANGGHTTTHELGHYFYLKHTFETYYGAELVNGSNCSTAGDLICDTPADPYPNSAIIYPACTYYGTATDANNQPYSPLINNIMSYTWDICRSQLTPQQHDAMYESLKTDRSYLISQPCLLAGINDFSQNSDLVLYPNPTTGKFIIRSSANIHFVSIYNVLGETVYSSSITQVSSEIDLSNNSKGIYFVKIIYENGATIVKRIIYD